MQLPKLEQLEETNKLKIRCINATKKWHFKKMSYATPQDFIDSFPLSESQELTNLDGYSSQAPTTNLEKIQTSLDKAYSEINSYRAARGDLFPFNDVSKRLRDIEIIIARKNLNAYSWPENDPRYRDYKDVIKWLESYAKGLVSLPKESGENSSSVNSVYIPLHTNNLDDQIFRSF